MFEVSLGLDNLHFSLANLLFGTVDGDGDGDSDGHGDGDNTINTQLLPVPCAVDGFPWLSAMLFVVSEAGFQFSL